MKKYLSRIISQMLYQKKLLLGVIVLVLAFSFIPFHVAQAGWLDPIVDLLINFVDLFIGTIAAMLGFIFGAFANAMIKIIQYFMGLGIAPSAENTPEFIKTGWNVMRNFSNMFFILILVFIGLATILRLPSYEYKKTLPLIIIIALLINFSGVLVGFIVDMSNLVTMFFLNAAEGAAWESAKHTFNVSGPPEEKLAIHIAQIIYYFAASIIYLIFMIVFAIRTMFLWVLVILAPLAFASYILPATRTQIWGEWWKQLISWSIFAIPAALFLYLASLVLGSGIDGVPDASDPDGAGAPWLASLLAPFTALFILYVGAMASMKMAPAGAQAAINLSKKAGKFAGRQTAGRFLATESGEKLMTKISETKFGLPEGRTDWKKTWTDRQPGKVGFMKALARSAAGIATAPVAYPARWGLRAVARQGLQYGTVQTQKIDERTNEFKKKFSKDYVRAAATYSSLGTIDHQEKIALARYLAETKGTRGLDKLSDDQKREVVKLTSRYDKPRLDDIAKYMRKENGESFIEDEDVGQLIQQTLVSKPKDLKEERDENGKLRYKDNDVQRVYEQQGIKDTTKLIKETARKKLIDEIKASDLDNENPSMLNDKGTRETIARWKPWSFIRKIGEDWGGDMIEKLQTEAQLIGLAEIAKTNATFLRAPDTMQGDMLMRRFVDTNDKEITKDSMKQIIQNATQKPAATSAGRTAQTGKRSKAEIRPDIDETEHRLNILAGTGTSEERAASTKLDALKRELADAEN